MTETPRRRYRVRLRRAMAGSFLAAATAGALTGVGAAPALAAPASVVAPTSAQERLAGVRADLDNAVLLRLVTPEQAGGFYAQIERRVAAGL
ncbi:hypothetical protein [Arthrobacter sp. TMS1-12-1]